MGNRFIDRTGYKFKNRQGESAEIVVYNGANDVWVLFEGNSEDELVHTTFGKCKTGYVKNPNYKSVVGIGYVGFGIYKVKTQGKLSQAYKVWSHMLERCYSKDYALKHSGYEECTVCEEWHNYQNFAKWYEENYYELQGEIMQLDKDWLSKGNKIYSPKTCIFVPKRINGLIVKCTPKRKNKNLPLGVIREGRGFRAECKTDGKPYLGCYSTAEEAFMVYKKTKEQYIKQVAKEYEDKIPHELYEAMISYTVCLED